MDASLCSISRSVSSSTGHDRVCVEQMKRMRLDQIVVRYVDEVADNDVDGECPTRASLPSIQMDQHVGFQIVSCMSCI